MDYYEKLQHHFTNYANTWTNIPLTDPVKLLLRQ